MNFSRWLPWISLRSHIFGHHLHFAVPPRELTFRRKLPVFLPTVSSCCGEETLAFYDSAYDARSGTLSSESLNESAWAALEAECDANGIPDELSLARRKYCHCEPVSGQSLFLDIWVHRNGHCGDLRDPANLRRAGEVYITQELEAKREAEAQGASGVGGGGLFDDGQREIDEVCGVNWRQRDVNGRRWQLHEEYHHRQYFGESWLLPLGERHFLRIHLYRMGGYSTSREDLQELRTFIESHMHRFHVHSPSVERERAGDIDIEPPAATRDTLDRRQALEEETARMPYLIDLASPRVQQPVFYSHWWWLLGLACLARGFMGAGQYLGWDQVLTIAGVFGFTSVIHQKLKNLAHGQ